MKKIIVLAMLVMLVGCGVRINEIELATKLCEPHGGVAVIYTVSESVRCQNGVEIGWGLQR